MLGSLCFWPVDPPRSPHCAEVKSANLWVDTIVFMARPLVSIIVCTHNRKRLLVKALESAFRQHYDPAEIIVLDDGSNDGTSDVVAGYGDAVRYHWQPPAGTVAARNAACQMAAGHYIAFLDDDDLMPPNRIVHLYDALQMYPSAVFATGDYALLDADGRLTDQRNRPTAPEDEGKVTLIEDAYNAVLWPRLPVNCHTTLFRREDGERIRWFDSSLTNASEDKDFFARLARLGPIAYLREVVSFYRRGHGSMMSDIFRARCSRLRYLAKHLAEVPTSEKSLRNRLRRRMLHALKEVASTRPVELSAADIDLYRHAMHTLSLLGPRERLEYTWFARVRRPLYDILKRAS